MAADAAKDVTKDKAHLVESYGKVPLSFEPNLGQVGQGQVNQGQTDGRVQFLSRGPGYGIFLTPGEAVLAVNGKDRKQSVLEMKLVGADVAAKAEAEEKLPGVSNYMRGTDQSKWVTEVPTYQKVKYAGVYPGVDLVFYGNQRQLEYDFVVGPGQDAGRIALEFKGTTPKVDAAGDLVLAGTGDEGASAAKFHKPTVYQMVGGKRVEVAGAYEVDGQRVKFWLGKYDHSKELVIDPVVTYLTYLGGSGDDQIRAIAVDSAGATYVTGYTTSTDFPLKGALQTTFPTNAQVMFVTKLNQSGTSLVYSTFVTSNGDTNGAGIAVDGSGDAYVVGSSDRDGFPVTSGAYQTICGASINASGNRVNGCTGMEGSDSNGVLIKLSPNGASLMYATYLGGNKDTYITAVALNAAGQAYVTGATNSTCGPGPYSATSSEPFQCFPTTDGSVQSATIIPSTNETWAFLTVFDPQAANLVYSSILGPDPTGSFSVVSGNAIAVNGNGLAFITGGAGPALYVTDGSFQGNAPQNSQPAFVAAFDPTNQTLIYSTFLGGTANPDDFGNGIAADNAGNAYVAGSTYDCDFPTTTGAYATQARYAATDTAHAEMCQTGFVAKIKPDGSGLVWATYLGDAPLATDNTAALQALVLGSDNSVYVAGSVQGPNYPSVNPVLPQQNLTSVATVTHLSADGSSALFSSTVGGPSSTTDSAYGIALDSSGAMYVAGITNDPHLPTTSGAAQPSFGGDGHEQLGDGFVVKIGTATPPVPSNALTTNLLLNPGAELAAITDWTAGGGGTATVDKGSVDPGISPHTGGYDFVGTTGAANTLSQTVSIIQQGITTAEVDGGTLFANVSYWEQDLNEGSPSDDASVTLTFLDASNATISTVTVGPEDSHDGTWANVTGEYPIPSGTRSITYVMNFIRSQGTTIDAFIDDNSLTIDTNTGLTVYPSALHFGTVAVGSMSQSQMVTVTNNQTTAIGITQIMSQLGANPDQFHLSTYCPQSGSLAAGASCPVTIDFLPTSAGAKSAGIAIGTNSVPAQQQILVDGNGMAPAGAQTPVITWPTPAPITTATPLSATQLDATAADSGGNAVPGTFVYSPGAGTLLSAGITVLHVTFTPTDTTTYTTATGQTSIEVTQAGGGGGGSLLATKTTLSIKSANLAVTTVAAGSVVTLTAAISGGDSSVSPAQVAFCDATATGCTGIHLLATAQVTEAGTAIYKFVPGIGVHNYRAVFLGTSSYGASASVTMPLAVTGTYPTTTAIAQSGTTGNYTLTATTVGAAPYPVQANTQPVTITLGQSQQNYVLTGTGASTKNGSTYGNFYNTQGNCFNSGSATTCDLTGTFTSTTPGYASGTYDFKTVFTGSAASSITSQSGSPVGTNEPNGFQYTAFAPSTVMTLNLNVTGGGVYSIPIVENGDFDPNLDNVNFVGTSAAVCGGTSIGTDPCQEDYVGTVAGATYTTPITGAVQFEMAAPPTFVGPTGTVSFLDTSNGNAPLGTGALGASTAAFSLTTATGSPVTVGNGAYGVTTGDFNNDGFADIAVENYLSNTVSVLLGKGDGTFQAQVAYPVGTKPERVLTADLNGDGNLDLVVANTGSNTISVLLGNGDGTFQTQVTYPVASPVGLGLMDINHDGIPDVVAGDYYANTMSVLLGKGDGTFQAAVTYPTGSTPQTVAEGDFNGDGNVDVVVGNEGGATVGVFLGNGDGTFQTMVTYPVGNLPQGVQVADFNSDGKQDLAVTNQGDGTVSVLLGNGDGTFQTQVTYPVGVQPVGIEVADFNGDGIPDITVGNTGQASLTQSVLLGKGDGTFAAQVTFPTGNFPYGVAVADFNGDGLPDMAVANYNDATSTIFLSQVTATATATTTVTTLSAGAHQVVASYPGDANYVKSVSAATALGGGTNTTVITWTPTVATIVYGTALGASQLNATAATAAGVAIPGTFTYTPASGAVLTAGTQTLSVAFTPTSTNFSAATGTATITVTQATPVITWAAPAAIPYGTPLSATQLDATVAGVGGAVLPGTLVYAPAAGTVLNPGTQMLSVTFTPTDAVDYTTATATVPIMVGGLALTSISPVGAVIGSTNTTITLTGTGFVATSMVLVNGNAIATTYVNGTTLKAVVPTALMAEAGTLQVTVDDPSLDAGTTAQNFTVVPPAGAATLSGPAMTDPGTQPSVTLSITNPYPLALQANFTLTFASASGSGVDDPSIQFSSGGRTYSYTVAANSTTVPPVQLQAGTDAGTITITATLLADGVDVTPAGLVPVVIVVPPVVPVITGTTITRSGNTLTVVIHGYSNTREMTQAVFDFTAATGDMLAMSSSTLTLPATTLFGTWYSDTTSQAYGSTFTYTQIFNTSGDATTVGSVKVTLTNSVGTSEASTAQ